MISRLDPPPVVLSPLYQLCDLALKSQIATIRYGFLLKINSRFNSTFLTNVSNSFTFWFGDLYKHIRLHNLPSIAISKLKQPWSIDVLCICIGKKTNTNITSFIIRKMIRSDQSNISKFSLSDDMPEFKYISERQIMSK